MIARKAWPAAELADQISVVRLGARNLSRVLSIANDPDCAGVSDAYAAECAGTVSYLLELADRLACCEVME